MEVRVAPPDNGRTSGGLDKMSIICLFGKIHIHMMAESREVTRWHKQWESIIVFQFNSTIGH